MKKLKDLLNESYAWERKTGKPLPTLSEVQAEYERNLQEETEYKVAGRPVKLNKNGSEEQTKWTVTFENGSEKQYSEVMSLIKPRPKLQEPRWQDNDGDGKWYEKGEDVNEDFEGGYGGNKRRRWDDKPGYSRGEWDDTYNFKRGNDVEANWPAEWNELVDSVNQDPNIEASEEIDYRAAISRLTNTQTGQIWELIQPQQGDMYVMYRPEGRFSDRNVKTLEDLIASFKQSDLGVASSVRENMRRFGTKNLNEVDAETAAPQIAKNNSCWDAKKYPLLARYVSKQNIDIMGIIKVAITIISGVNPIGALTAQYTFFKQMNQQELTGIVNELKSFASCISKNYASLIL